MTRKETVKQALEELKTETTTLLNNIKILEDKLETVNTDEDSKEFDDLADELTSGFKHLEIF